MLKCYKTNDEKIPCYLAHSTALKKIFGEDGFIEIKNNIESGIEDNFSMAINSFNYAMLKDNDAIKHDNGL